MIKTPDPRHRARPTKEEKQLSKKMSILKASELIQDENFDIELTETIKKGCTYVNIVINNKKYEMLKDSGAEISAISESYYEQIIKDDPMAPTIPLTGLCIHNAIGDKATKVSIQILVPIEINKNTVQTPFIVVKNLNEKGIIGNDNLEVYEASIDFGKRNLILNINDIKNKIKMLDKIQEQPVHLRTVSTEVVMEPSVAEKQVTLPNKLQKKLDQLLNQFPEVFSEMPGKIKRLQLQNKTKKQPTNK